MHRGWSKTFFIILCVSGAFVGAAFAQSDQPLGDVARVNRANKQTQDASGAPPKVITNQDLPAGSTDVPQTVESDPMTTVSGVKKSDNHADQQLSNRLRNEQRVGAEWKARIQEQENRIADLQARIDRVNASIHSAVGTAAYDTPANRYQAVQSERLATMQELLDQQKRRLAMMQDAARRAGMGQ
jgi:hypothetical protein